MRTTHHEAKRVMRNLIRTVAVLSCLLLLAMMMRAGHRNAAGYCASTGQFMTREIMIDAAIKRVLNTHNQMCSARQSPSPQCATWITYDGPSDFKARNPECCTTGYGPDQLPPDWSWLSQFFGGHAGGVRVQYRQHSSSDRPPMMGDTTIVVDNCGNTRSNK
jgi:hypothetical protein